MFNKIRDKRAEKRRGKAFNKKFNASKYKTTKGKRLSNLEKLYRSNERYGKKFHFSEEEQNRILSNNTLSLQHLKNSVNNRLYQNLINKDKVKRAEEARRAEQARRAEEEIPENLNENNENNEKLPFEPLTKNQLRNRLGNRRYKELYLGEYNNNFEENNETKIAEAQAEQYLLEKKARKQRKKGKDKHKRHQTKKRLQVPQFKAPNPLSNIAERRHKKSASRERNRIARAEQQAMLEEEARLKVQAELEEQARFKKALQNTRGLNEHYRGRSLNNPIVRKFKKSTLNKLLGRKGTALPMAQTNSRIAQNQFNRNLTNNNL